MGKEKPPKGGEESWKKAQCHLRAAGEERGRRGEGGQDEGVTRAMLAVNCNNCHNAHKPD